MRWRSRKAGSIQNSPVPRGPKTLLSRITVSTTISSGIRTSWDMYPCTTRSSSTTAASDMNIRLAIGWM